MSGSIKECLELQLSEMEMLFSMFPRKGEINLEDANAVLYVRRYLDDIREAVPPKIEFSISVEVEKDKVRADLHVSLPHDYPHGAGPQLFARSAALDRELQKQLNENLTSHIHSLHGGELCISTAIQWLQDNVSSYVQKSKLPTPPALKSQEAKSRTVFHRMWIYSHHIYRQELRKKILECAKRLNLTGFCLTGKPGVICVEGLKEQCEEFWRDIRYPNWKHISCKHTESVEADGKVEELCLFPAFEELMFEAHGDYGLRNDYHMDLGQFLEYLKQHQSEHIFQILFGVEGKI
ncbi:RWD domain-containing protein 2A [Rhinatrema bivittatum]|uniref:RWD domain-containing protein 2A n=1 Tax=Rhinatrema bivittatum TaxID=194408 RepID=UPI001128CCBD|nr:RWD domain-containing protein 2A [Rhinatrema bivittatum]XP_029451383.1 RWD domain-containing protein 2A [Rhinatrema bivittatum]XP_029451384.1 RWD domain-containing protein 2A [Rhinatrema bivittatum]XP_029451386.1 RWD domain-containing protein 2A [Rhinatrema bivittatum]XP_029451387.1 RWD domain-containing protein 2A [Rhinatrema bivittatum]